MRGALGKVEMRAETLPSLGVQPYLLVVHTRTPGRPMPPIGTT